MLFPAENSIPLTRWVRRIQETQKLLGCPMTSPKLFCFLFFFSSSFFSYLDPIQDRNPWVRNFAHSHKYGFLNLPRNRKEVKCNYSASKI